MPYNMWFVTPAERASPAGEWIELATAFRDGLRAELIAGTPDDWQEITVREDDWWWFNFRRYSVATNGDKWADDLGFFQSWLAVVKPEANARWVADYLRKVQTVYKFECSTSGPETNMDLVNHIVRRLRADDPSGLLYAELEGWLNEMGAHITWEFSDGVAGDCLVALRRPAAWAYFRMELGDPDQRRAFQAGEMPAGLESLEYADRG